MVLSLGGKDAYDAVHNAVVMEQVAKMASIAYAVNPNLTMNPLLIEKHFSPQAWSECLLRTEIIKN